jgi:hypothetical protein
MVGTDARQRDQFRGDLPHQPIELCVQLGDLCRERLVTAGTHPKRLVTASFEPQGSAKGVGE